MVAKPAAPNPLLAGVGVAMIAVAGIGVFDAGTNSALCQSFAFLGVGQVILAAFWARIDKFEISAGKLKVDLLSSEVRSLVAATEGQIKGRVPRTASEVVKDK